MNRNAYIDGMMGLVVGDALGVPYEFSSREQMKAESATDMIGYGTYNVPAGTWSDDSSMALATLDALRNGCDLEAIMRNFADWLYNRNYTPYGEVFDIGFTCRTAISNYVKSGNINTCGCGEEYENGNGSLMRILPACIYFCNEEVSGRSSVNEIIKNIHAVSALTHSHLRSMIACGLYYFLVKEIIVGSGSISERLQKGFNSGFAFYEADPANLTELAYYESMRSMAEFSKLTDSDIKSSGYVVSSLEAAVWCAANTSDYRICVLKAVNLGSDTDTVAAIAGGIAGLYYGYDDIPEKWKSLIAKREWIERLCHEM